MSGRPRVVATADQIADLKALAGSERRDEADRARALLLSLDGWTSARLGEAVAVAAELLAAPVENRQNWTLPRLQAEIEKHTEVRISTSRLSVVLREKGAFAGAAPDIALKAVRMPRPLTARD